MNDLQKAIGGDKGMVDAYLGDVSIDGFILDVKEIMHPNESFTKLEKAALMIAQGIMSGELLSNNADDYIARQSVSLAKAVLEEANK